jgi:hypothetical protein
MEIMMVLNANIEQVHPADSLINANIEHIEETLPH